MTDGFMDQMELYGAVRKGRDEQRSFTLNAIAEKEIDDKKLDYSEDGNLWWRFLYSNGDKG